MDPRDRARLERIVESIDRIDAYVERAGRDWPRDPMVVDAVAKRIEWVGELAKRLSLETLEAIPAVDWRAMKGAREVIVYGYDGVDIALIEDVVAIDLPTVRAAITEALRRRPADEV